MITQQWRMVVELSREFVKGEWIDFDEQVEVARQIEMIKEHVSAVLAGDSGFVALDLDVSGYQDKGAVSMWSCYPRPLVLSIRVDVREKPE
jgi:hypothetical protein